MVRRGKRGRKWKRVRARGWVGEWVGEAGKGSKLEYKKLMSCSFGARGATTKLANESAVGGQQ